MSATQGGTVGNIQAGPASISFKGVVLGFTQDGQEVSSEPTWADIVVDQFGAGALDALLEAQEVTVTTILSEFTLANLQKVLGGALHVIDGAKEKVTIGRQAGFRARTDAGILLLHPITRDAADVVEDITLYKAYVNEAVAFAHTHNEVKSYEVVWRALVDETKTDGNHLFAIGDTSASADVTAPSVASIVPADDATGIAITDNIVITLTDDDLLESSMDANSVVLIDDSDDSIIAATRTWASGAKTITLNPTASLSAATKYRVVVTGLVDVNQNVQATPFSSNFTTA